MSNIEVEPDSIRRVNRKGLAKFFGATVADVDKFVEMGMPYVKRATGKGDEWIFDTAHAANWLVDRARITGKSLLR